MAYTVSQTFKEKIKDETALKSCLILFDDLFFSTSDFTDSGVVFNQFFNTSEDLTYGDCPSDTLSFAVIANGKLGGYSFGKCRAYVGVQTDSQPYAFGDSAHIESGNFNDNGLNVENNKRLRTAGYIPVPTGATIRATYDKTVSSNVSYAVSGYTVADFATARVQSSSWLQVGSTYELNSNVQYVRLNFNFGNTVCESTDLLNLKVYADNVLIYGGETRAYIEIGAYTWTASESGLYCGDTLIDSDEYVSLVSDGTKVYAVGTSSSYSAKIDGSDGAEYLPHAFMVQKLRSGLSAVFEANTANVWDGENVITIEYVPMGQYNVVKPRSTVGDIVEIQDAYDNMNLFDADASQFLESLTYPVTLSGIYTALCDFVGVEYVTDTFLYSDTSYASSPFADTSCSLRDILWWIAERARAVAHCDREGRIDLTWLTTSLDIFTAVGATTGKYINASGGLSSHSQWSATDYLFVYPNTEYTFSKTGSGGNASCFAFYTEEKEFISSVGDETTLIFTTPSNARYARFSYRTAEESTVSIVMSATEVLTASDIGQDGYSVAEYKTPEVTGVLLRSGNGTTLSFGSMTAPYMISANPFVSTITNEDLEAYESIPTYIPMELMVLEADPSVDIGDMIDVRPMVDEILALTNVYDEVYSEDDEALSIEAPTYQIPLMNRTLTFMGGIRASYTATGDEIREADLSNTEYNASVAPVTQTDVFNRLTNGGEQQGIYLEDGKIYINGEYIKANSINADLIYGGTLSGAEINIGDGAFTVDSDGTVSITKGELNINFSGAGTETRKFITGTANITSNSRKYWTYMQPNGFYAEEIFTPTNTQYGIGAYEAGYMAVGGINDMSNANWAIVNYYGQISINIDGVTRVLIDPDIGIRFRNSSGTITRTISPTGGNL